VKTKKRTHKIALILLWDKHFILKWSLLLIILSDAKTELTLVSCDDRIQLYWECTNSTLPSILLESIWSKLFKIMYSGIPIQYTSVYDYSRRNGTLHQITEINVINSKVLMQGKLLRGVRIFCTVVYSLWVEK